MNIRVSLTFFLLVICLVCFGQVRLPYLITDGQQPTDSAKTAADLALGSMAPGYFSSCGLPEKEIAPDFILYDTAGVPCQLSVLLAEGKPVLLITVSLTCPQSRKSINEPLATIYKTHGRDINIRLIYVIDAHPKSPDVCPYSGEVFTTPNNFRDSILLLQPKTYSERKELAKKFIGRENPGVPVLIDSPENIFWKTFGPAPNNAYLLTPTGMIYKKYGWFENPKGDISGDITRMLASPVLMKKDISKDVWIAKSTTSGNTSLFIGNGAHYEISIIDQKGKKLFNNKLVVAKELDLEKIQIPNGEYSIVVKTSVGLSYCIPYKRQ